MYIRIQNTTQKYRRYRRVFVLNMQFSFLLKEFSVRAYRKFTNYKQIKYENNKLQYLPSQSRLAMFGGKIMCKRLTFFSLSLSTAKLASSIELFNLSILLRRPSCKTKIHITVINFGICKNQC